LNIYLLGHQGFRDTPETTICISTVSKTTTTVFEFASDLTEDSEIPIQVLTQAFTSKSHVLDHATSEMMTVFAAAMPSVLVVPSKGMK